jgi:probable HAF family extracellular repeat protein
VQFTRVLTVVTVVTCLAVPAACSSRGASTAGTPSGSGAPETEAPERPAPKPLAAAGGDGAATRPRVLVGHAPAAAGVDVVVTRLRTDRPGGRVTGLSASGVAVGVTGRHGATPTERDAERAVRWDADGKLTPLPAFPVVPEPRIGPDGLIAFTAPRNSRAPLRWNPPLVAQETTAETADGDRPRGRDDVAAVVDVGTDDVLVDLRPRRPSVPARDDAPPAGIWSPRTGDVTPIPLVGRFLTPDGGVVGDLVTGVTEDHPDGSAPALWRPGGSVVRLEVPRGWKGDPRAGTGDTVVGKLTRNRVDAPADGGEQEQPPAAAVAWRGGRVEYLPPLGGRQSIAVAVNRRGTVVGTSRTPDPGGWPHAVIWRDGRVTDLGTLDGEGESWAVGVSENDVAVGYSSTRGGGRHAVAWVRGGIVDLGAAVDPAATSQADGIVGRRVYGRVSDAGGVDNPVIWTLKPTRTDR